MKILFLTKQDIFCKYAEGILKSEFNDSEIFVRDCNARLDLKDISQEIDYIISFLITWVVPEKMLQLASKACINFHPAPPKYPGIGCYNFALYNNEVEYGVTCHHMSKKVDSGEIIDVSRFPVSKNETVESLKLKSMIHLLKLFQSVVVKISHGEELLTSKERWHKTAYTRLELEKLRIIDPMTMAQQQVNNIIRATSYPGKPGPVIHLFGHTFEIQHDENQKPIT